MTANPTRKLRSGFTTGAAAAAAAKGALSLILDHQSPRSVWITFLTGQMRQIAIHSAVPEDERRACCTVIKDAGDDPDVTHKAEIGARVQIQPATEERPGIDISGGPGVGRVTKPGLEVAVGQAAINPGPVQMIRQAVQEVLSVHRQALRVQVEVFVPKGEELALKTLNARLGIVGGISILGTTGIERPMSHEAYLATIEKSLSVARACGNRQAVLTTGRRSERFAQKLWPQTAPEALVQIGDFFKASLQMAAKFGFQGVCLAVFFGKALKMAQGSEHTHAARGRLTLEPLARWSRQITGNKELEQCIRAANTARQAFDLLQMDGTEVIRRVGNEIVTSAQRLGGPNLKIRAVIFDYQGRPVYDSQPAITQSGGKADAPEKTK
jgi:cobalt-precorrin-5B (C1)-methyltransferase